MSCNAKKLCREASPVLDQGHRLFVGRARLPHVAQRLLRLADGRPGLAGDAPALAGVDDLERPAGRGQRLRRTAGGELRKAEGLQRAGELQRGVPLQADRLAEVAHGLAGAGGLLLELA
jgi:hypothetical protein